MLKWFICFSLFTIISSSFALSKVNARPEYAKDLPMELKNYCIVCHSQASGRDLNTFGQDYFNHGNNITSIKSLDSDGDGYINEVELENETFPGDPESFPGASSGSDLNLVVLISVGTAVIAFILVYYVKFHKRTGC
jgi:hypothetical protein